MARSEFANSESRGVIGFRESSRCGDILIGILEVLLKFTEKSRIIMHELRAVVLHGRVPGSRRPVSGIKAWGQALIVVSNDITTLKSRRMRDFTYERIDLAAPLNIRGPRIRSATEPKET